MNVVLSDRTGGWRSDLDFNQQTLHSLLATGIPLAYRVGIDFEAPEEIDARPHLKTENQGPMGSCRGNGLTTSMEWLYYIATGEMLQLSRIWAYLETQRRDGLLGSDQGSTIKGGLELALEVGVPRESLCPYPNPIQYPRIWRPSDAAKADAANFRLKAFTQPLRSFDEIFAVLAAGYPVSTGTMWGWEPDADGIVRRFNPRGGGHATELIGFGPQTDDRGRKFPRVFNSWGPQWGDDGTALLTPDVIEQTLRHPYTIMFGLSDLIDMPPRKVDWAKDSVFT